jgi:hypothetical protein
MPGCRETVFRVHGLEMIWTRGLVGADSWSAAQALIRPQGRIPALSHGWLSVI